MNVVLQTCTKSIENTTYFFVFNILGKNPLQMEFFFKHWKFQYMDIHISKNWNQSHKLKIPKNGF